MGHGTAADADRPTRLDLIYESSLCLTNGQETLVQESLLGFKFGFRSR